MKTAVRIYCLTALAFLPFLLIAQPTVDGDLGDSQYILLASKANSNEGFGPNIDVTKIYYYPDAVNGFLYLGIAGKLNTSSNDGIGVWLNVTGTGSPSGKPAGQSLGIQNPGGHYIGANNNSSNVAFKADFEVDYMFAFNPGSSSTNVYFDAAKHVGTSVLEYQGLCNQSGTSATNGSATSGAVFTQNQITFAFNNGGGTTQGLEMKIPFTEIGATSAMQIQVFAFVVSNTAFFSNVTVPGNVTSGNPGSNADFSTISGGPYHTQSGGALPVGVSSFTVRINPNGAGVLLEWQTVSELNNYGFYVQRRRDGEQMWTEIPGSFVPGHGTTTEPQYYSYVDNTLTETGLYHYRLRQQDLDGTSHFTPSISIEVTSLTSVEEVAPRVFQLLQNYPNPFNPTTTIKFSVETTAPTTLELYNVLGQKVATLFDEVAEAGKYYRVKVDGSSLASGMYLYRLHSGDRHALRKLLLLK